MLCPRIPQATPVDALFFWLSCDVSGGFQVLGLDWTILTFEVCVVPMASQLYFAIFLDCGSMHLQM